MSKQVSLFSYFGGKFTRTPTIKQTTKTDPIAIKSVMKGIVDEIVKAEKEKRDDLFELTKTKLENWKKKFVFFGYCGW